MKYIIIYAKFSSILTALVCIYLVVEHLLKISYYPISFANVFSPIFFIALFNEILLFLIGIFLVGMFLVGSKSSIFWGCVGITVSICFYLCVKYYIGDGL